MKKQSTKTLSTNNKTAANQTYTPQEAIAEIKKTSKTKFDASIELHLRLGIDTRKGDQQVRGAIALPHGTGKTVKVAAFVKPEQEAACKMAGADLCGGEDLIAEIAKTEKTDFAVAVADPTLMKSLAKIAKILGTRGLMPNPKNETVNPDPAAAVKALKAGKVSFKNDDTGNLHLIIGKVSFAEQQLLENYQAVMEAIKKAKPASAKGIYLKNVVMASTMGSGIKVQI